MPDSVADLLSRLTFVSEPVETIYLNRDRVHDDFIGQLGAIESFTRSASKDGRVELPILKAGAGIAAEAGVTWTLTDPTAQALVLRAALESQGLLRVAKDAEPGSYVWVSGTGRVSRPGMFDDEQRSYLEARPGLYDELESDRAKQESVFAAMGDDAGKCWLMTIDDGTGIAAAVLNSRWLGGLPSWLAPIVHENAGDRRLLLAPGGVAGMAVISSRAGW